MSKETDALGNYNTYITDLAGNVTEMTDKREIVTENIYGPYGILSSNVYNESSEEVYNYTYDSLGHVKQIQLSDGTNITDSVSYTYDAFGRVTQESNDGFIHAYGYDISSNLTQYIMAANGEIKTNIAYAYNSDNLLTSQTVGDTITTYQYNDNNNLTQKVTGNYTTNITYNQAGLPKTYKTNYGTIPYSSYTYSYRTDGNRTSEYDSIYDVNKSYTYDGTGRLTRESVTGTINKTYAYTYDKRGNRTGETVTGSENHTYVSTYDANNRLLSRLESIGSDTYEGTKYVYDNNGNLTNRNDVICTANTNAWKTRETFSYTVSNRLQSYTKTPVISDETAVSATYTYKATGMRDTKTVGGVTTGFVWSGDNMVAETNSSGVIQNQYHYGVDGILSATLGTTNVQYLKDAHGNVVGTASSSGLQDNYYIYDAFGNSLESDPNESNPFGYCGEYLDSESGLVYLRNRYYDTTTGRFTSEDPVKDGLNWYSYCAGNPVMFVDPLGLKLQLQGTGDEVQAIWTNIKEFSQDELLLTQLEDENGNKLDIYEVTIVERRDGGCNVGTELVRRIVDNTEKNCTIKISNITNATDFNETEATNGTGSDVEIIFKPMNNMMASPVVNPESGNVTTAYTPDFILLAHEMCHADRAMRGVMLDYSTKENYTYQVATIERPSYVSWNTGWSEKIYDSQKISIEELATIGLKYNKYDDITENMIREEHGIWQRGAYYP